MHDFAGGIITPGFVDCHTHLVFGGNRSGEFEQRLNGVSYAQIAAAGGGIISTVNATRQATEEELIESALFRLRPLLAEGVTSVEIKIGLWAVHRQRTENAAGDSRISDPVAG